MSTTTTTRTTPATCAWAVYPSDIDKLRAAAAKKPLVLAILKRGAGQRDDLFARDVAVTAIVNGAGTPLTAPYAMLARLVAVPGLPISVSGDARQGTVDKLQESLAALRELGLEQLAAAIEIRFDRNHIWAVLHSPITTVLDIEPNHFRTVAIRVDAIPAAHAAQPVAALAV